MAFGRLARAVIDAAPDLTVVAVTGSSGKTSTKDLLAQVLGRLGPTVAAEGSYNSEVGVPLTVVRVDDADTRYLVVEMGARGAGHIDLPDRDRAAGHRRRAQRRRARTWASSARARRVATAKSELVQALSPSGAGGAERRRPGRAARWPALAPAPVVLVGRGAPTRWSAPSTCELDGGRGPAFDLVSDLPGAAGRARRAAAAARRAPRRQRPGRRGRRADPRAAARADVADALSAATADEPLADGGRSSGPTA